MKNIKHIDKILFALAVSLTTLCGCCTDEGLEQASRLFRPVNINLTANENTITATWAGIADAESYYVELFGTDKIKVDDQTSYTNYELIASEENVVGNQWTVGDLDFETTYYFRLKANSSQVGHDSRFTKLESIKTPAELQVVNAEVIDIDNGTVRFSWMSGFNLLRLILTGPDGAQEIAINDADKQITIEALPAGSYTVEVENATRRFNTFQFMIPILKEMASADISFEGVIFRWAPADNLTRIVVEAVSDATDTRTYDISALSDNFLFVSDLGKFVTYRATIYIDQQAGNTITFTTKDAAPEGMITVSTVEELKSALSTAADGAVIALNPGSYQTYTETDGVVTLAGLTITKSVTLMAATDQKPVIVCKGLSVNNTAEIDHIIIRDIEWDATAAESGGYLIDHQTNAQNVRLVEITGCYIHDLFNSVVRADRSSSCTVLNVTINDCLMLNMNGKQCIIAQGKANDMACNVGEVKITNSTIAGVGLSTTNTRMFSLIGNDNMRLTLSNNTFVTYSTTNPFIHYRYTAAGSTTMGQVSIKSNIFYNLNHTASFHAKAPNFGNATLSIADNSLAVPWVTSVVESVITDEDWSSYESIAEDPKLADVDNNDFTVGNQNIITKGLGDPRWLK